MNEETLFHLAQQKPPSERPAYLDGVCPDGALRQRVESLLEAHDNSATFMDKPAIEISAMAGERTADTQYPSPGSMPFTEAAGSCIGHYKLLQEIGQGGMGTVFMAEQTHPVRRRVALKIIRKGMDSRQVIARFEAERQALALMDHPNIARVLDAGTTNSGRPYFVMELVKGIPITRYCDEHRLSPVQRLALFVSVCHAVHHAHQKGIIHRDIKPSNVLVAEYDGKPVSKVIDFGVAKAAGPRLTADTLFTELGAIVGTVEYMSPEQAGLNQLDVDTRSDIYSLGVLLYELLTGTTPLESKRVKTAALLEVLRLVREEEAPRPSTRLGTTDRLPSIAACRGLEPRRLSGLVRGELDWIVMRTLDKDRSRRYESANGLASDILRYLDDEPVSACPPSAGYRLRKFVRRHNGPVLAASLVSLILVGGIAGTASQAVRAEKEASRANGEARRAGAEAERANDQAARASAEAKRATAQTTMAIAAGNAKDAALAKQNAMRQQAMATLEMVMDDLLERQLSRQATLTDADRHFCKTLAMEFREFSLVKGDTPANRNVRALGHYYMGQLRGLTGDNEQACFSYERAIPLFEGLASEFPAVFRYRETAATSHRCLGNRLLALKKLSEAEAEYLQAIAHFKQLGKKDPAEPWCRNQLGRCDHMMGMLLSESGRTAEAEESYHLAIAIREKLADEFPDVTNYAVELGGSYCNLGHLLRDWGNLPGAMEPYLLAIRSLTPIVQRETRGSKSREFLVNSLGGRATALERLDRLPEATQDWDRVLELDFGPNRLGHRVHRAKALARVDPPKAVAEAKELMRENPDNLEDTLHFAEILLLAGDVDEYKRLCARQIERYSRIQCFNQPGRRNYLLARLCLLAPDAVADSAAPSRLAEQAVQAWPQCSPYLHTLALARYRAGQYDEAIKRIEEAGQIAPNWPGEPLNWFVLAMAHHRLDHSDEARHFLEQAICTMESDRKGTPEALTAMSMDAHDWLTCVLLRDEATATVPDRRP